MEIWHGRGVERPPRLAWVGETGSARVWPRERSPLLVRPVPQRSSLPSCWTTMSRKTWRAGPRVRLPNGAVVKGMPACIPVRAWAGGCVGVLTCDSPNVGMQDCKRQAIFLRAARSISQSLRQATLSRLRMHLIQATPHRQVEHSA